jgi:hypothetical protein
MGRMRNVNAIKHITPHDAEMLRSVGGPGLIVRKTKKGEPVFYLWQAFGLMRLSLRDAKEFAREIAREERKYHKRKRSLIANRRSRK